MVDEIFPGFRIERFSERNAQGFRAGTGACPYGGCSIDYKGKWCGLKNGIHQTDFLRLRRAHNSVELYAPSRRDFYENIEILKHENVKIV